jgi:hypothetical protein
MRFPVISRPLAWVMAVAALASAGSANAGLVSVTDSAVGDLCNPSCTYAGTTGTVGTFAFGTLTVPTSVTFSDNLGTNDTGAALVTTDNFTFAVPTSSAGASVTGDQINLNNFSVTGTLDSFTLYSVTASGAIISTIATGTQANPFTSILLDPSVTGGLYELQIVATLASQSTGSYSGVVEVAAPAVAPLPPSVWLMASALLGLGLLSRRRTLAARF